MSPSGKAPGSGPGIRVRFASGRSQGRKPDTTYGVYRLRRGRENFRRKFIVTESQGNKLLKTCFQRCFFGVAGGDQVPRRPQTNNILSVC